MATHPADRQANNPRVQCSVCGKWKRLKRLSDHPAHPGWRENFYGGCSYRDGDHFVSGNRDGDYFDVCVDCCDAKCAPLSSPSSSTKGEG